MLVSFEGYPGQGMTLSRKHFELLEKLEEENMTEESSETGEEELHIDLLHVEVKDELV